MKKMLLLEQNIGSIRVSVIPLCIAWVKVFRIIPEFRILKLKVGFKMLNKADFNSFSDFFLAHLSRRLIGELIVYQ